ncbi:type II secretion system protein J [Flagellimonas sp. CMM7]|uniref:PulJ/GspJ family protein n=1 Tax=Flagellimonas sp. CMM7 TaxID=2654676 RepID=UPI0013D12EB1|nr:hypothetical protein [Flagellimonas sp. CMM7]UII80122.1 hypothetical protein LV704_01045 [Flagellimonas sp. CMM7]
MQELLVAMVISSLIIGLVYSIYVQLNKQLYSYSVRQQEMVVFEQFKQVLASDIFKAMAIEKSSENNLRIAFRDGEHNYLFLMDKVVRNRKDMVKDTFHLAFSEVALKQNKNHTSIELTTILGGEPFTLFEGKEISAANRINSIYNKQ